MASDSLLPDQTVAHMMKSDYFSQWMGLEIEEMGPGYCRLRMKTRRDMLNGFGIVHGGVTFSMADSAFAFASNSHGRLSVSLNASITYPKSAKEGDILIAEAKELSLTYKTATYDIEVRNQQAEIIALFRGTVYRTSQKILDI
ncbi:MAG: hydroxyphenylacetyl-CoA thioesterase PaaI [Bacteroidota bacterium]